MIASLTRLVCVGPNDPSEPHPVNRRFRLVRNPFAAFLHARLAEEKGGWHGVDYLLTAALTERLD